MWETTLKLLYSLLRCIVVQIHILFDCIVDFVFGYYYQGKNKKIQPVDNQLLLDSAVAIAEKIR